MTLHHYDYRRGNQPESCQMPQRALVTEGQEDKQ